MDNPLRDLPSVNDVLDAALRQDVAVPRAQLVAAVRREIAEVRRRVQEGDALDGQANAEMLAQRARLRLQQELKPKLRRVLNATGIVLHTNLGRAPVAEKAARAAYDAARGYLNLELDLETGKRSSRQLAIREWLCRLTGAESATAVNNNAAATIISLRALCQCKEVIVSRGQLIEIGGSFRIPEIMAVSGAILREVGTTNITRLSDFERAINPQTAALMRIHTSNYRVAGFTEAVPLADLVALGQRHNLPVIDDVGSGALLQFPGEPLVQDSVAAGADLVLFSGDKLLGGPQAGLIVGKQAWIERIEIDPLMRAFRLDKMTLAALEATLRLHLDEQRALAELPTLRMLTIPLAELKQRAKALAEQLSGLVEARVREDSAYAGGGSLPDQPLPSWVVEVKAEKFSAENLATRLRLGCPAVLGRLHEGRLLVDVRTLLPGQDLELVIAIRAALAEDGS